jgi:hypothetical protein
MKKILIFITIILAHIVTCNAQIIGQKSMCSTFYKLVKGKDFNTSYTLELRTDSTFVLIINTAAGSPSCKGKWEIVDNVFVLLKCDEDVNSDAVLSSGYMAQKEHKLRIINKNKIEYKDVVLKRRIKK